MEAAEEAWRYYQKRFRIETFFSDQQSRGFHIHKSHISDPQRLSRLLIAACLAVSDHRGSNSQPIDFQGVEIYPVLTAKIENTEKSST